jgi:PhnB protein
MTFYKECLGGELTFKTIGESPLCNDMPAKMKASILHASLKKDELIIIASDMVDEIGLKKGNSVSLMLNCNSEEEIKTFYSKLALGGTAKQPLEETFWGAWFGGLTDRFGNNWLFNYDKN